MMETITPAIFIGLGDIGAQMAERVRELLTQRSENLKDLLPTLVMLDDGSFHEVDGEGARREALSPGPQVGPLRCQGLKTEFAPGVLAENRKAFEAVGGTVSLYLTGMYDRLKNIRVQGAGMSGVTEARTREIKEGETLLFVFSPLFDAVGSSVLPALLGIIQTERSLGRLRGVDLREPDIIAYYPDLFDEIEDKVGADHRAYCCLQELDHFGDHPEKLCRSGMPFRWFFLFGAKNSNCVDIGSHEGLTDAVAGTLFFLITNRVRIGNLENTFQARSLGKRHRYSSMGFSQLTFPAAAVMGMLGDRFTLRLLEGKGVAATPPFEAAKVSRGEVRDFVLLHHWNETGEKLRKNPEGRDIWDAGAAFRYSLAGREGIEDPLPRRLPPFFRVADEHLSDRLVEHGADRYLEEMEAEWKKHREAVLNPRIPQVADQFNVVLEWNGEEFRKKIDELMETEGKGTYYTSAFTDALDCRSEVLDSNKGGFLTGDLKLVEDHLQPGLQEANKFFSGVLEMEEMRRKLEALKKDQAEKAKQLEKFEEENAQLAAQEAPDKFKKENLARQIKSLKEQLLKVREEAAKIEGGAGLGQDLNYRRSLIDNPEDVKKIVDEYAKIEDEKKPALDEALRKAGAEYQQARHEYEACLRERSRYALRRFILMPMLITALVLLLGFLSGRLPANPITGLLTAKLGIVKALVLSLAAYGLFAFFHYLTGLRRKAKGKQRSLKNCITNYRSILLKVLPGYYDRRTRNEFECFRFHYLHRWYKEIKARIALKGSELRGFIGDLESMLGNKKDQIERSGFHESIFFASVATRDDITRWAEGQIGDGNVRGFFQAEGRRLKDYFRSYSGEGGARGLEPLEQDIAAETEKMFRKVREKTIDDFLREEDQEKRKDAESILARAYKASSPFILLDGSMNIQPEIACYLSLAGADRSHSKRVLEKRGIGFNECFENPNPHELDIIQFMAGFPAYAVNLTRYGYSLSLNPDNKTFTAYPDMELGKLLPSAATLGSEDNEDRILLCLARAFGHIKSTQGRFTLKNVEIGASPEEAIRFLCGSQGRAEGEQLEKQIASDKKKANARNVLTRFRDTCADLDDIDKKIIDNVLQELSAL